MQINGYIPPHVPMHLCRPSVVTRSIWVCAPVAHDAYSHRTLKMQQKYNTLALVYVE